MQRLTGIGVSPGVVSGRAVILIQREQVLRYHVAPQRLEHELARLEASRKRAMQQLTDIRGGVALRRGPDVASIFDAQLLMLADPYLRERKGDVADLVGRLKMNLRPGMATPRDLLRELDEASVLIADELTPSLVAQIDWTKVRGFATDAGSRTYHSAILARSLDVPAVVGLYDASRTIQPGQIVVIDGSASELLVDPTAEELARVARHGDD